MFLLVPIIGTVGKCQERVRDQKSVSPVRSEGLVPEEQLATRASSPGSDFPDADFVQKHDTFHFPAGVLGENLEGCKLNLNQNVVGIAQGHHQWPARKDAQEMDLRRDSHISKRILAIINDPPVRLSFLVANRAQGQDGGIESIPTQPGNAY